MDPTGWQADLAWRIVSRRGLDFYIVEQYDNYWVLTTKESGYRRPSETREPTGPELDMWTALTSPEEREMLKQSAGLRSDRPFLKATPEEMMWALNFCGPHVYVSPRDAASALGLPGFAPCSDRAPLLDNQIGTSSLLPDHPTRIYASRVVPYGYYLAKSERAPGLHWRPSPKVRELRPEADFRLELELHVFRTDPSAVRMLSQQAATG